MKHLKGEAKSIKMLCFIGSFNFFPSSGIYALARQWKTVIVGAEGVQNMFVSTHPRTKKPVVGRGNLPAKHLQYLSLGRYDDIGNSSGGVSKDGRYSQENEIEMNVLTHEHQSS